MTDNASGSARPVLIVGAGPAGLTAAIELTRRGVPIRCVDRAAGPSTLSKALGLWPRTLELFRRIGGDEIIAERALPQSQMRYYSSGKVIANLRYSPVTQPVICPQPDAEHLLRTAFTAVGGRIEWDTEFLGLEQDSGGVRAVLRSPEGVEQQDFAYVIGADGASSKVRGELGIGFSGSTYELQFVVADVVVDSALEHNMTHYFCSPKGILVTCGLPSGRVRVFTSAPPGLAREDVDLAAVQALVDERGPGGLALRDPEWISLFAVHARHADRTRVDRAFLVGDAAHIHSPAGGQGLNTGVTDAHNLAWKLALVWHGQAVPSLVDTYETERGQVAHAVVRQAHAQTRIWLLRKGYQVALRDLTLRIASALRLFDIAYVPWLAGLRTTYATAQRSKRALDGFKPGALVPATPVFDTASGRTVPLRAALTDLRYTLLVSGGIDEVRPLLDWAATCADVLDVKVLDRRAGTLSAPAEQHGRGVVVLVRPDGHVDLRVPSRDSTQVRARVEQLFQPFLHAKAPAADSVAVH
jgi:3-(3-hydroxy-phenyl)propionate hydroxylase